MASAASPARLVIKVAALFFILQLLVVMLPPSAGAARVYNLLGIARERFPISMVPPVDAALDVGNLDAMFAAHVISKPKRRDEFRVVVLGDSTVYGMNLTADEVLPGQLNRLGLECGDRKMRFYNLSFPRPSATKDIMILDRALEKEPDAIVWLVTWYTLMPKARADHWLVDQNPADFGRLGQRFDFLPRDYEEPGAWDRIFDRSRRIFRTVRFALYALVQLGTGRDQISGPPQIRATELSADETFEGLRPPTLRKSRVSLDQVQDLLDLANSLPVLIVNEPIQIMDGIPNSDIQYNRYYPRWVYDQYRAYLGEAAMQSGWHYLDMWNMFSPEDFTDTPLHLTAEAHGLLAERLVPDILSACRSEAP